MRRREEEKKKTTPRYDAATHLLDTTMGVALRQAMGGVLFTDILVARVPARSSRPWEKNCDGHHDGVLAPASRRPAARGGHGPASFFAKRRNHALFTCVYGTQYAVPPIEGAQAMVSIAETVFDAAAVDCKFPCIFFLFVYFGAT